MSMYLPNPDVGPVGAEPGEFIDYPSPVRAMGSEAEGEAADHSADEHQGVER